MCIQGIVSQSEETKLLNSFISSAQSDSSGVSKIIGIPSKRTSCIKRRKKSIPISPCRCSRDGLLWSRVLSWSHSGVYRADSRNYAVSNSSNTCHTHSLYHSLLYTCGRYQANSNARLVIHPVNDMSQLPELISHIATLPAVFSMTATTSCVLPNIRLMDSATLSRHSSTEILFRWLPG